MEVTEPYFIALSKYDWGDEENHKNISCNTYKYMYVLIFFYRIMVGVFAFTEFLLLWKL